MKLRTHVLFIVAATLYFLVVVGCKANFTFIHSIHKLNTNVTSHNAYVTLYPQPITHSLMKLYRQELDATTSEMDKLITLAYSIMESNTKFPLVVLTLPERGKDTFETWYVSKEDEFYHWIKDLMTKLNMIFIELDLDVAEYLKEINKDTIVEIKDGWLYNKIFIWQLTLFQKLIYIHTSMLVKQNIDHLFYEPSFSGVPIISNTIEMGLFVVEPSQQVFNQLKNELISYKKFSYGSRYFFNHFFHNIHRLHHRELSSVYNLNPRLKNHLKPTVAVWNFDNPTRPWDFWKCNTEDWFDYYEPVSFYDWVTTKRKAYSFLSLDEFKIGANNGNVKVLNWDNVKRSPQMCDALIKNYHKTRHHKTDQFTVLIGTWDRIDLLETILSAYQTSPLISKIFITWHNPNSRPPLSFLDWIKAQNQKMITKGGPMVEFLYQTWDSLNNRFNPVPMLDTRAVLICDEDVLFPIEKLKFVFDIWKQNQNSLVGIFPRGHTYDKVNHTWEYHVGVKEADPPYSYSMILTKFMFMKTDLLFMYTCLLPSRIHHYIDSIMNCEDICMNLLLSGMTGVKNIAASVSSVVDFGTTSGISSKLGHTNVRSDCLTKLMELMDNPSLYSNIETVEYYQRDDE